MEVKKLVFIVYIPTTCVLRSELPLSEVSQYLHGNQLATACIYNKAWCNPKCQELEHSITK